MARPISISRLRLPQGLIFWREVGYGEALVFLHGSTEDSSQWLPVMEHLGINYHCFAPDLIGFGESEHPNVNYSIAWLVETLAEYFAALNLQRFYLVGHSLGAWVGASYALKYPEQVMGLVILSPEGVEFSGYEKRRLWSKFLLGNPPIVPLTLKALLPIAKIFGFQARINSYLRCRQLLLQSYTGYQLLFARHFREIEQEFLQGDLHWLKTPMLVLQGGKDSLARINQSQIYAGLCKQAKLRLFHQGGEDLPEAFPAYVTQEIEDFIRVRRQVA